MVEKKKNNDGKKRLVLWILLAVLAVGLVMGLIFGFAPLFSDSADPDQTTTSDQADITEDTEPETTAPLLAEGLELVSVGRYEGSFLEDGSNETVSEVMSIVLQNTSDQDLQLAQIEVTFPSLTAQFQVTNLPAGEQILLLEQNRAVRPDEDMTRVESKNVVFFDQPMDLMEDTLKITGTVGSLEISNITDRDLTGDITIYYKNVLSDMLYGGITYRVRIEGGLAAGESTTVSTGHYHPDTSRLIQVTSNESAEP